MSKKDKKDKKLFGLIDLNDPMMIGVVVVLFLLCVYFGVVLVLGKPYNPLEWFKTDNPVEPISKNSVDRVPPIERVDSLPGGPTNEISTSGVPPIKRVDSSKYRVDSSLEGGKLLKKLRRR